MGRRKSKREKAEETACGVAYEKAMIEVNKNTKVCECGCFCLGERETVPGVCGECREKKRAEEAEAERDALRHAAGVFVAATEHELEDAPAPVSEWFDDALGARYEELRKQVEQGGDDEKV